MAERLEIIIVEDESQKSAEDQSATSNQTAEEGQKPGQQKPASRPVDPGEFEPTTEPLRYEFLALRSALWTLSDRLLPTNISKWFDRILSRIPDAILHQRDDSTQFGKFVGMIDDLLASIIRGTPQRRSAPPESRPVPMSSVAAQPAQLPAQPSSPASSASVVEESDSPSVPLPPIGQPAPASSPTPSAPAPSAAAGAVASDAGAEIVTAEVVGGSAGASRGIASLGPIGAAVAGVVLVFTGLAVAANALMGVFKRQADQLENYNGAIAGARAEIEANRELRLAQRAERIAPQLASLELAKDQIDQAFFELATTALEMVLKFEPEIRTALRGVAIGVQNVEAMLLLMKSVQEFLMFDFKGSKESVLAATNTMNEILENVKEMAMGGNQQGVQQFILNHNPFEVQNNLIGNGKIF